MKFILEGRKQSSYLEIKKALMQIPDTSERFDEAQYYLAHISYIDKDFNLARQYFDNLTDSSKLKDKAEWYAALCKIHLE